MDNLSDVGRANGKSTMSGPQICYVICELVRNRIFLSRTARVPSHCQCAFLPLRSGTTDPPRRWAVFRLYLATDMWIRAGALTLRGRGEWQWHGRASLRCDSTQSFVFFFPELGSATVCSGRYCPQRLLFLQVWGLPSWLS